MKRSISFLVFLFCLIGNISAQEDHRTKTESAVNLEEAFANAQREILVGREDKGLKIYEELYRENRTNPTIAFELAKIYKRQKNEVLVEKYAKIAIDNSNGNEWYTSFYADYLMSMKKISESAILYGKLIQINPNKKEYYHSQAECYKLEKKKLEFLNVYNLMERNLGPMNEINKSKFEYFESENDFANASKEIDALISRNPSDKQYLKAKARLLIKNQKNEDAVSVYKKILTIDESDTDANLAILSKGDNNEKPNAYLMSLLPVISNEKLNIDVKIAELLPYVKNLINGNNVEEKNAIIEVVNKLMLTHPNDAKALALYGDVLMNTGDIDGAIVNYEKTIKLNNKIYPIWEQLMIAHNEKMDYPSLYSTTNKALDLYPNQAMVYYYQSLANIGMNKTDEAIASLEEGKLVSGGNKTNLSKIATAFAKVHLIKKDFSKAQIYIEEALLLSENKNSFAYEILGDLYQAKGQLAQAVENWKKSKMMGNNSKQINLKLESNKL
ncbi:MAG: hypothetical protein RLZZ546_2551 [Bacteroidota bacterium]|jgi:tetratricopeptide (TPR) repeat protein